MDEIQKDLNDMEEDAKKINCSAILDFFKHFFKCINDSILFICKGKKE